QAADRARRPDHRGHGVHGRLVALGSLAAGRAWRRAPLLVPGLAALGLGAGQLGRLWLCWRRLGHRGLVRRPAAAAARGPRLAEAWGAAGAGAVPARARVGPGLWPGGRVVRWPQ